MAVKNTLLGGTDWIDGEVLNAVDINDTFDASPAPALKHAGLNLIRQLQDRDVEFNGDGTEFADAYISSTGRKGSVTPDIFNFDIDEYKRIGKIYDTDSYVTAVGSSTSLNIDQNCTATAFGTDRSMIIEEVITNTSSTPGWYSISILKGGVPIASKTYVPSSTTQTTSFKVSDYSEFINQNDTFTISINSQQNLLFQATTTRTTGTLFNFTSQSDLRGTKKAVTFKNEEIILAHRLSIENNRKDNITSTIGIPKIVNYEDGSDIKYRLFNRNTPTLTLHNPDGFSNTNNLLDYNLDSFASLGFSTTSGDKVIGVTFSATTVKRIYYKVETSTLGLTNLRIQNYDGSTWTDAGSLSLGLQEGYLDINSNIQGIRFAVTASAGAYRKFFKAYFISIQGDENQTTGWLDYDKTTKITTLSGPTDLEVKLIPKSTSPTVGFPSIKGFSLFVK